MLFLFPLLLYFIRFFTCRKCRSDILTSVDNYALLCLDIVWCYLCLQNINDLPDAEERLSSCDLCFRKTYGQNLERLALVRVSSSPLCAVHNRLCIFYSVCVILLRVEQGWSVRYICAYICCKEFLLFTNMTKKRLPNCFTEYIIDSSLTS